MPLTTQELRARRQQRAQQSKREGKRFWLWALPLAAIVGLIQFFSPAITRAVEKAQNPPLRGDVVHLVLLSNSKSDEMLRPKSQVAQEVMAISEALGERLGAVHTRIIRFASAPGEIYDGPNDSSAIQAVLEEHYLKANPDPRAGTLAALALEYGMKVIPTGAAVIITIGTDAYEDVRATRDALSSIKSQRKTLVLAHGIPTHNVQTATRIEDLRGQVQQSLATLGDDGKVVGQQDFAAALNRWLPEALLRKGLIEK